MKRVRFEVGTLNKKVSNRPVKVTYSRKEAAEAKKHYNFFKRSSPSSKRWLYKFTDDKKSVMFKHVPQKRKGVGIEVPVLKAKVSGKQVHIIRDFKSKAAAQKFLTELPSRAVLDNKSVAKIIK